MEQDIKTLKLMTLTMGALAFIGVGLLTATMAFADTTYYYVNTAGLLETETAATPTEAIEGASDIKADSGVIVATALEGNTGQVAGIKTTANPGIYAYVTTSGDLQVTTADSADAALMTATDIKYNSGVMAVTE